MTTVDVETFAFLQAKEVVSGLTEDERTRLKLHIALEREENHLTILKKEGFFAPLAGYSSAELVHLTQKLGLRVPEEGYDETRDDAVEAVAQGARLSPSFGPYLPNLSMKNAASDLYFESAFG